MVREVWNSTNKRQLMDRMKAITSANETKEADNHRGNQEALREIQQLRQKLRQLQTQLQEKDEDLQLKDEALQQSTLQIQELENTIATKDDIIQRNDTTIRDQQQEISRYRNNPHWAIQGEEVEVTGPVLGRGGWGEVKVAIFRGKRVAVKCLYEAILSPHYLQLFSREMEVASHIRHPNLLQFIGATRVGNLMIVTELMQTSLRSELEKSQMTRLQVISIAFDVACGLNYLHSWRPQPILHRDVSSGNVLLDSSGNNQWRAKLSDYGSVNLLDHVQTANPGSPIYSAPESIDPAQHSPAMDVYSFGILVMEMATGQFPSFVMYEREAQIRGVKWRAVRDLIVCCTISGAKSRPNTSIVLDQLREIERRVQ